MRPGLTSLKGPKLWISLALGTVIFYVLLKQVSGPELLEGFRNASIPLFLAALPFGLASNLIRALRFRFFFPAKRQLLNLFGAFATIRIINYVVPFRLGEGISVVFLKKLGFSPSIAETAPVWVFFRFCDLTGLLIIAIAVGFTAALPADFQQHFHMSILVLAVVTAILILLTFPVVRYLNRTRSSTSSGHQWFQSRINEIRSGLSRIQSYYAFMICQVSAILIWLMNILGAAVALFAFGAPLSPIDAFLIATLVTLIELLPVRPPLGLGVTDTIWSGLMIGFGVPLDQAIIIALGVRLVVTATVLLDAGIAIVISMLTAPTSEVSRHA
jgi:uncharacterized protein (TIRG00374 family)